MKIITHRGIDTDKSHVFTESSREAFWFFLAQGLGLEFDVRITKDGTPVIAHDSSLSRLTGQTEPEISSLLTEQFLGTKLPHGHTLTLTELASHIRQTKINTSIHALHLKHYHQNPTALALLIPYLRELTDLPLIVFDVLPAVAKKLKQEIPTLRLAASVAHSFDIDRYNSCTGGTLLAIADLKNYTDLYDWVWLDEWDRTDRDGGPKALYTEAVFSYLRTLGYQIAVVSPELHATSPQLLGGESHPDACSMLQLEQRWRDLVRLAPDAICTDHPSRVAPLLPQI